jgi:hypothetical protein
MRYVLAKSTGYLTRMIRRLPLIVGVVLVFGSTPVFARGGGHGGGHSGGHGGHSGAHGGHDGGHAGGDHGRITRGSSARDHFTNQNPCISTNKISGDCPQFDEKQSQTIPAEKAGNRFESRFE